MNTVQNGKGSKPRPIDKKKYDENFDSIRWSSTKTTSSTVTSSSKKVTNITRKSKTTN